MNKFDFNTIKDFDNHINTSIKGYDLLHNLIINLSGFFLNDTRTAVDYGCTSGRLINNISDIYKVKGIGYDITDKNFLEGSADLIKEDITSDKFQIDRADIYYLVFTLQFLPINEREKLLNKIYSYMPKSSILIVCEKEISGDGFIQEAFTFTNYDYKKNNYTPEDILKKEEQLRNTMRCMTPDFNKRMFFNHGFTSHLFFKSLNFSGYILTR